MRKQHLAGTLALALSVVGAATPVVAQSAGIQLAFGYDCGDQFRVRNDGVSPVDVEYGTASSQRSQLHLNARESVAISSIANDAMELWVNGRRVATEAKGNRSCAQNGQDVVVRPLNSGDANSAVSGNAVANNAVANSNAATDANYGDNVAYSIQPRVVYVNAPPYNPYYSSYPYYGYSPYYGGYYGGEYPYGYYGYTSPRISIGLPFYSSRYYSRPGYINRGPSRWPSRGPSRPPIGHSGGGRTAVRR